MSRFDHPPRFAAVIGALVLWGCTGCTSTLYDWGSYEQSLLNMYSKADGYNTEEEIDRLLTEVEQTLSKEKLVPPGKNAHLGYLFYLTGDTASAAAYFRAEKQAFPESRKLMDRLLEQLK